MEASVVTPAGAGSPARASAGTGPPASVPGLNVILEREEDETRKGLLLTPFAFQCPPTENFNWGGSFAHTDYDTATKGQRSRRGGLQLRTTQFQTLSLDETTPWGGLGRNPLLVALQLQHLYESGTPFWLHVGQLAVWERFDLSMLATMRTLSVEERAGEPDTRYFDIAFTEWKALEVNRARFGSDKTQRVQPTPGQTLRDLAVEYYRDPNKWRVIAQANGITGFPPDRDLAKHRRGGRPVAALTIPPITRAERS